MMLRLSYSFLFLFPLFLLSQRNGFGICFGGGPNYVFNSPNSNYNVGISEIFGANYSLTTKNEVFTFKPDVHLMLNDYNSKIQLTNGIVRISQRLIGINLEVFLKIGKKNYLKAGLFFNKLLGTQIETIYRKGSGNYYAYSTNSFLASYSPQYLQAGMSIGAAFPLSIKKRDFVFNLTCMQFANSFLEKDYSILGLPGKNGNALFNAKVIPAMFLFSFDIALKKNKEKKKNEEEGED